MQVEYATDVVFTRPADFAPLYAALTHTAIHAVKPDHVATFLGRKLTGAWPGELGNDFETRIQGTRIKHHMGPAAIKLYDKFGLIGRVECTTNDVTFFKHHRLVEHRDGTAEYQARHRPQDHLQPARPPRSHASGQRALPGLPGGHRRSAARVCASWRRSPSRCAKASAAIAA